MKHFRIESDGSIYIFGFKDSGGAWHVSAIDRKTGSYFPGVHNHFPILGCHDMESAIEGARKATQGSLLKFDFDNIIYS